MNENEELDGFWINGDERTGIRDKMPSSLRFEILERDCFRCRYCGCPSTEGEIHIDHIIPQIRGGITHRWNLTASCTKCNVGKGSTLMSAATIGILFLQNKFGALVEPSDHLRKMFSICEAKHGWPHILQCIWPEPDLETALETIKYFSEWKQEQMFRIPPIYTTPLSSANAKA